jgi:hypothetical protein
MTARRFFEGWIRDGAARAAQIKREGERDGRMPQPSDPLIGVRDRVGQNESVRGEPAPKAPSGACRDRRCFQRANDTALPRESLNGEPGHNPPDRL